MTLRIHEEPETGTARLLKRALAFERLTRSAARNIDRAAKAAHDIERKDMLLAARMDIDGAIEALGAKPC